MIGYKRINTGFKNHTAKLQMTVTRYADEGTISAHFHSDAELIHVTFGEITVKVNHRSIKLCENEFLIVMPEVLCEISYGSAVDFWIKQVPYYGLEYFFDSIATKELACAKFNCDRITEMRYCNICLEPQRVFNYRKIEGFESEEEIDNMLYSEHCSVMKDVLDTCISNAEMMYFADDSERYFYKVLKYISQNFTKHCSAALFAEIYGDTDFNVRNRVKSMCKKCGFPLTFSDLTYLRRVEYAKHLLKTTDIPIYMVARQAGFLNDSRMNTKFLKYAGIRPFHYREIVGKISRKEFD